MSLSERVRKLLAIPKVKSYIEENTSIGIFFAAVTGTVSVIGVAGKILDMDKSLAGVMSHAVTVNATTKAPELRLWFIPIVLLIVAIAASLLFLVIWLITQHFSQSKDQLALQQFMSAVRQIRDQGKQTTIKAWDSLTFVYLIDKDLSGTLTRTSVMKAVDAPVHFCEIVHEVEDEADGADSLASVDYRVRDLESPASNIAYLASENNLRKKKACMFFLPPIPVGESRKFEITYRWPGMFKRLKHNTEDVAFTSTTRDTLRQYRLEVYLQEDCGGRLDCSITGNIHLQQSLQPASYQVNGWNGQGYIYEVGNIPPGDVRLVLRVQLKA